MSTRTKKRKASPKRKASAKKRSPRRKKAIGLHGVSGLPAQIQRLGKITAQQERQLKRIEKAAKAHEKANAQQERLNKTTAKLVGRSVTGRKRGARKGNIIRMAA